LGFALGFVLIDYGFNVISTGLPGARTFTSQFLAVNLLIGGSALVFVSLYYLLKPVVPTQPPQVTKQPAGAPPTVGVEIIVEEDTPPKPTFYKTIEYIGYFFTVLGLISAADLVLQVFLRSTYDELRWWVDLLLVTFGVLSYTIFGSIGRLGMQEEAKLAGLPPVSTPTPQAAVKSPEPAGAKTGVESTGPVTLTLSDFTRNAAGEYERHLSGDSYDMFRVDPEMVTVWREDRRGMRSVYLAGPYELSKKMLEEYANGGQELKVGNLDLAPDAIRGLLDLMKSATATLSVPPEE
jgi:hypothetical protein